MKKYNCGDIVNTEDNFNARVEKVYKNGKIKVSICENVDDKDLVYRTYTKKELDKYND